MSRAGDTPVQSSWAHLGIVAASAVCVYLAVTGRLRILNLRVFVFLGTISYSLYLIHSSFGYVVIRLGYAHGINGNLSIVSAMFLSLTLATGLTYLIERPAHALLRGKHGPRVRWGKAASPA